VRHILAPGQQTRDLRQCDLEIRRASIRGRHASCHWRDAMLGLRWRVALRALASARGIGRSLWRYYGDPRQLRRMGAFYRQFLRPGDLAFDIGAHVGSRTWVWTRLGARVVAVEPLPTAARVLRMLYGRSARVRLVEAAVGARPGWLALLVSDREPTVSTLSAEWAERMRCGREAFARTRWDGAVEVPVTTLDELIARYGEPSFCKIDTEGHDLEVLRGLSRPLRALSFEYVPPALDVALACLERLALLGTYEFNWSRGESMHLRWAEWVDAATVTGYLRAYPAQGNPGDVYARLRA
jgi:FkbM family methyltransferase